MSEDDFLKDLSECFALFDPVSRILFSLAMADAFLVEWKSRIRLDLHETTGRRDPFVWVPTYARTTQQNPSRGGVRTKRVEDEFFLISLIQAHGKLQVL
jgi:hypothetical protein